MNSQTPTACPRCGKALAPGATHGLCPACLMAEALASGTVFGDEAKTRAAAAPSPEEIAGKFPQFEILERLGRGGMGVVYKARQKSLNRVVALKILAPEREHDARFAERFAREAELLAKLSHPHIVTIHDFGQADGLFYIVMEFVDGVNLRDLLREGKIEPRQALAIVPPVCEALQYAHGHGVVHRDIKPENLLLDREGRVKIADFGIAALVGGVGAGGVGERAGTPPYMAPEQGGGSAAGAPTSADVDHRADIYALGVVLYEMLTGERPGREVVAPSRKVRIDVRLDEIVLRALEKQPERRYASATEFRTRIETVGADLARSAAPASAVAGTDGAAAVPSAGRRSRVAMAGAIWAGFSGVFAVQVLTAWLVGPEIYAAYGGFLPFPGLIAFLGATAPVGATVLGWIAIARIRRSEGRLRGIGLAVFLALLFPLIALNTGAVLAAAEVFRRVVAQWHLSGGVAIPLRLWVAFVFTGLGLLGAVAMDVLLPRWVLRRARAGKSLVPSVVGGVCALLIVALFAGVAWLWPRRGSHRQALGPESIGVAEPMPSVAQTLPATEPARPSASQTETILFGGVEWMPWRTLFEVRAEDGLVSLPKVRPGFEYGHWGHGRGPEIVTNIGNPEWRDYRIDADLLVPGVDPALNPHGLGLDFHGAMIAFHVVDRKESFNESGTSAYVLGFEGPGNWSLTAYRNSYCRQPKGWGSPGSDHERRLAGGSDEALDPVKGNRFRIEVLGTRIQVWMDGRQIVDVVDEEMGEAIGGRALDHGGVAFVGGFDAMIRLRSFEMTKL